VNNGKIQSNISNDAQGNNGKASGSGGFFFSLRSNSNSNSNIVNERRHAQVLSVEEEEEWRGARRRTGVAISRRRRIQFNLDNNIYGETHNPNDYDRGGVEYIAKSLTFEVALMIKKELNDLKKEMAVHEDSRCYTQFYPLR
jgi:hypothetical protein